MANEEYLNNYWSYARNELKSFKKKQIKENKKTQDRIQDIFNSLNITYSDLNKTIPKPLKDKTKRQIEEWENDGIIEGYFKYKLDQLSKGSINYNKYIEIMLIGAYLKELSSIDNISRTMFENVALEYKNKGNKDLKKKKDNYLPLGALEDLLLIELNGFIWKDYLQGLYLTYMDNTKKEYADRLRAEKEANVYDDSFQKIFNKQNNYLVSINDDKYSGGLDEYLTTYANKSYIDAGGKKNYQVRFVSDHCERMTKMCEAMDGMLFDTQKQNDFVRPYGNSEKELINEGISVFGLVLGINQPPITKHFHWCHSTLTYQTDRDMDELRDEIYKNKKTPEYKIDNYLEKIDVEKQINITKKLDNKLNDYLDIQSKWNGKIKIDNEKNYHINWDGSISSRDYANEQVLNHELIHLRSIINYGKEEYINYAFYEESVVEFLNKQIMLREKKTYYDMSYSAMVEELEEICQMLNKDKLDFGIELIKIKPSERKKYIIGLTNKNNEKAIKEKLEWVFIDE